MPALVRLYLRSILWGILLGTAFTALVILIDIAGLRRLMLETTKGYLAIALMVGFSALLFSAVQFGIAVMRMAENPHQTKPPGANAIPALVAVSKKPGS